MSKLQKIYSVTRINEYFLLFFWKQYIHLYSPRTMVAQSKKRATSKNTTNEKKEKSNDSSILYAYKLCNIKFTVFTTST